jgi:putative Mn2+ efflux pump MntP
VSFSAVLVLAVGLAMDAAAVSAARGVGTPSLRLRHVLSVAGFFGGFQALMPLLGWFVGRRMGSAVQAYGHFIAFCLLAGIGAKMLWEARSTGGGVPGTGDRYAWRIMLVLAIATSIDAFAVGVTLPMLGAPFAITLATIGITTALLSALALFAGRRFGALFGRRLDVLGGLLLIGLGVQILLQHLRVG